MDVYEQILIHFDLFIFLNEKIIFVNMPGLPNSSYRYFLI